MNEIVKQRIEDMESKADIQFTDKCNYVKVVRCKDCKYKHDYFTACCKLDGLEAIDLDSFCSKGVRR